MLDQSRVIAIGRRRGSISQAVLQTAGAAGVVFHCEAGSQDYDILVAG
jgi:hypothetical protein